jgi:hypothetical protein
MNRHLISIIFQYCQFKLPFLSQLRDKTSLILSDTELYWTYENYFLSVHSKAKLSEEKFIIHYNKIGKYWTVITNY